MAKKIAYSFYRPHKRVQYTGELVNHKTGEIFTPPSRTKQEFVEQSDINNILKQFSRTGQLALVSQAAAQWGAELPDVVDFQESLNTVIAGENAFASLPSKVRNRFDNDPAKFLGFMADPANQDEAIKLGLAKDTRPPPEPPKAPTGPTGGDGGKPPSEGPKGP